MTKPKRVVLAGQKPIRLWLLVLAAIAAAITITITGVGQLFHIDVSALVHAGIGITLSFAVLLGLVLVLPLRKVVRSDSSPETKKVARTIYRSWGSLVQQIFPGVTLGEDTVYPSIRHISCSGEVITLSLALPPILLPGGTKKYLQDGCVELLSRIERDVEDVEVKQVRGSSADLMIIVSDMTQEVREVEI